MTGRQMSSAHIPQFRRLFGAYILCHRATGVEPASGRRILRTGQIATQKYALPANIRVRNGNG